MKRILFVLISFLISVSVFSQTMGVVKTALIFDDVSVTGTSTSITPLFTNRLFQAVGTVTTGTGACTMEVQGSLDNTVWHVLDTLSLSLTTTATGDYYDMDDTPWKYIRGNISAISGTNATVSLIMGAQL